MARAAQDGGVSWGGLPPARQRLHELADRFETPAFPAGQSVLPYGLGRSYGDSCLNDGGLLLGTRRMDRYASFDAASGVLDCEAGASFADILELIVPQGWFLPVTPGTQFVTVGGAIANDVHGKNHHRAGSFGRHVLDFELLRSDGSVLRCSPQENAELFAATVGGLGLTGLIRRARVQMARVAGPSIACESIKFGSLAEFFRLAQESDASHEYTVAWVDCHARGAQLGRGLFSRGNHARPMLAPPRGRLTVPLTPPTSMVTPLTVRAFNALYYARQRSASVNSLVHYQPFFYPLDGILRWNRMYGPQGFYQYQCAVPPGAAQAAVAEMLERIAHSGEGSFLVVLKTFGDLASPGLLSFPRPGATLAIDFPNRGERTLRLLEQLDEVTRAAGGAVYPAKDARMSAADFQQYFPRAKQFSRYIDPAFSSSFWRRVSAGLQ